jgi:hypothetical protein
MEGLLSKLPEWVQVAAMYLGALTVVGTVVVRLTPSKKDDEVAGKVSKYVWKVIEWLPTIGLNPKTKDLKKAYEELKGASSPDAN